MKSFLKTFLATLAAFVVIVSMTVCGFITVGVMAGDENEVNIKDKTVLIFKMNNNITEAQQEDDPFGGLERELTGQGGSNSLSMTQIIQGLDKAAKDDRILALYLEGNLVSENYGSGPAALLEIRQALGRFKAKKPIYAYNTGWSKSDLMLVAGASHLYLDPMGAVDMTGLVAEPMFYGDAFKKYGIEVQVTRVGKFKAAVEPFITNKMSDANREQISKMLSDIWSEWKLVIGSDRKLQPEQIQAIADQKGFLLASEAKSVGIIDEIKNYDEVLNELKKLTGKKESDKAFNQVSLQRYLDVDVEDAAPRESKNRIAIVFAEGEIVDGNGSSTQIGGNSLSRQLRRLRMDPAVKAVVLRVNSPGGSAVASDLIQREIILIQKEKPVVVSMGYVAASGGYWISAYSNRIFAEPNTITGSIGVFGLLPNVKRLANSVGITWDSVQTSKLGAMQTLSRPKTEAELARIQTSVDMIYSEFIRKVSEGRRLKPEFVNEIAQGRIWSGKEAIKLGLVDELGGLGQAIDHAVLISKLGDDYQIDYPQPPKGGFNKIFESLGKKEEPMGTGNFSEIARQIKNQINWLNALNDPNDIYARVPFDLNLK
ncbi:signal peptide peptidase SppA [Acidobacteriota bacterium]|nr:signal peptide peptidase SppA [Acidobacteriota bacterium]